MADSNDTRRIIWPDMLKGLAVLMVAVGHNPKVPEPLVHWIYSFHIPAFFFVAGYFWKLKGDSILRTFRVRAGRILPIYFGMSAVMLLMDSILTHSFNVNMFIGTFIIWMTKYSGYLWFLPCFLVFTLIFSTLGKWISNLWIGAGVSVILAAVIYVIRATFMIRLPLDIDVAIVMLPFGYLGRIVRYIDDRTGYLDKSKSWHRLLAGLLLIIAQCGLCILFSKGNTVPHVDYNLMHTGNTLVAYLSGITGVLGLTLLLSAVPEISPLTFAGRYSIVFYCMCWLGARNFFGFLPVSVNVAISLVVMYVVSMIGVILINRFIPRLLK